MPASAAGIPTVVAYVIAGDALLPRDEAAARARDRRRGIQDAYRVSGDVVDLAQQDEWHGEVVGIGGHLVEEFRLRDRPGVRVTFLGLPDGRLPRLSTGATLTTVPAEGGLVAGPQRYDADDVVTVLCGLMERYRPTVLHVTELVADRRYDHPQSHPDHRAATALALEAARRYRAVQDTWLPHVLEHRDSGVGRHPVNLDGATRTPTATTARGPTWAGSSPTTPPLWSRPTAGSSWR